MFCKKENWSAVTKKDSVSFFYFHKATSKSKALPTSVRRKNKLQKQAGVYNVQENVGNLLYLCFFVLIIKAVRLKQMKSNFCTFFIIYKARVGRAFFLLSPSNVSAPEWMDFCPDTSGSFSWSTRMLLMRADFFYGDSCLAGSILPCGVLEFSKRQSNTLSNDPLNFIVRTFT